MIYYANMIIQGETIGSLWFCFIIGCRDVVLESSNGCRGTQEALLLNLLKVLGGSVPL